MAAGAAWSRVLRDRRGSIAVQTVLLLVVLIGFTAMGVEITNLMLQQRKMQAAADAAVMAAGIAGRTLPQARIDALAMAGSQGFVNGSNAVTVTVNKPPSVGSYGASATEVIIEKAFPPLLLAVFTKQAITVRVRAISSPVSSSAGCLLALDPSSGDAATIVNNSSISNTQCELVVNSTSSRALVLQNSSFILGPVYLVGNYILGNGASITGTPLTVNAGTPVEDPYATVTLPTAPACPGRPSAISGTVTLQPGRYCSGMVVANGANVTLSPGVYFIDQFFTLNQNATVTGSRVTLLFNSATASTISQNVSLTLTAPLTGTTAGLAIASQRNVGGGLAFENNTKVIVEGAIYLPGMTATISGKADTGSLDKSGNFNPALGSPCTQLIANKLVLGSKIGFRADCSGTAVKPIGRAQPVLVE